jgi:carbamoyl-phosphate synthase large subunit
VSGFFVKTPVFPFVRFPGVDTILGPEMKSTGEVMGAAPTFGTAFAKAQIGAGMQLPLEGTAFISVNNHDKPAVVQIARDLRDLGFRLVATRGTASYLRAHGLSAEIVFKVNEGRPHVGDEILNDRTHMVITTPPGRESFSDDRTARIAMMHGVLSIDPHGRRRYGDAIRSLRSGRADRPRAAEYLPNYNAEGVAVVVVRVLSAWWTEGTEQDQHGTRGPGVLVRGALVAVGVNHSIRFVSQSKSRQAISSKLRIRVSVPPC